MEHVMLDLETWGTLPGCAIRSIGAIFFDPFGWSLNGPEFYRNVSVIGQENLFFDPNTEAWWDQQPWEAVKAFADPEPITLELAAFEFSNWWLVNGGKYLWCHGATFDEPVWRTAVAKAFGGKVPWHYRDSRDTRTLFWLAGFDEKSLPKTGISHNALDDCRNQINAVQTAFWLAGFDEKSLPKTGISHNALDDCRNQINAVQTAMSRLRAREPVHA